MLATFIAQAATGDGLHALVASLAVTAAAVGLILIGIALAGDRVPHMRRLMTPLNAGILLTQLLDGATTWIGVDNPFGMRLPPYEETVFLSAIILDALGGFAFFILKGTLGVVVIIVLAHARRAAHTKKERMATVLVQVALVVIGAIPVYNNVANFLAAA